MACARPSASSGGYGATVRTSTPTGEPKLDKTLWDLAGRLHHLVRRELLDIVADPRSPERGQYAFVQSLIREVAYATLARRDRRSKHLAAARVFEAIGDEEHAGALATHYLAAHEASDPGPEAEAVALRARVALRAAADRAASLGGHDQALVLLEQALSITTEPAERAPLLERAALAADTLGRYPLGIERATEALARLREVDDEPGIAHASGTLATVLLDAHQTTEAIDLLERTIAALPERAVALKAELEARLSRAHSRAGRWHESVETADRALAIAEPLGLRAITAEAMLYKGTALSVGGRPLESASILTMSVDLADQVGDITLGLAARNNLALALGEDAPARAVDIALGATEMARRLGRGPQVDWLATVIAVLRIYLARDWDDAVARLTEADRTAPDPIRLRVRHFLVMILCLRGRLGPAQVVQVSQLAKGLSDPFARAAIGSAEGFQAWHQGEFAPAADAFLRAARADVQGAVLYYALSIRMALRAGDLERARAVITGITEDISPGGRLGRAERTGMRAIVDALEGRPDAALHGFRAAIDEAQGGGFDFLTALYELDALIAIPDAPEVLAWAEEARAILERVDARLLIDRLEQELERSATA